MNGAVYGLALQSDGKVVIGGAFNFTNGMTSYRRIARFNSDGTFDTSFSGGSACDNIVRAVAVDSSDKIYIGGDFQTVGNYTRKYVARLNSDGSVDTAFGTSSSGPNGSVLTLLPTTLAGDPRLFIGGSFTQVNGLNRTRLARLLASDGTPDSFFSTGTGVNNDVESMIAYDVSAIYKLLIGGRFSQVDGISRNGIARIDVRENMDLGLVESCFDPGNGAQEGAVAGRVLSSYRHTEGSQSGKVVLGGTFTTYNSTNRNRVARIMNGSCP